MVPEVWGATCSWEKREGWIALLLESSYTIRQESRAIN
jgi:hypothetical protein